MHLDVIQIFVFSLVFAEATYKVLNFLTKYIRFYNLTTLCLLFCGTKMQTSFIKTLKVNLSMYEINKLLHGKCARIGFLHSSVLYQTSHSFAALTRSISDTSPTPAKIPYARTFHEVISILIMLSIEETDHTTSGSLPY